MNAQRMASALLLTAASVISAGCASTILSWGRAPVELALADAPRFEPPAANAVAPRVALVLSGGSARALGASSAVLSAVQRRSRTICVRP